MLNTKKLFTKILDMLYVSETQTLTACGKSWVFKKIGKVVYLDAPGDISSASSGWNSIGTLNTSMRPVNTQRIRAGNSGSTMYVDIQYNGTVRIYCPNAITSASNGAFSTCFIVN